MGISVIVGIFGDEGKWADLANDRALPSVYAQTVPAVSVHLCHADTLHEARNYGAQEARGEGLVFLDADDELDPGYLAAMQQAVVRYAGHAGHRTWLIRPATLGIRADGVEDATPVVLSEQPLIDRNFMVIGTLVSRGLFQQVGGFRDWSYGEDWELWLRCRKAGAGYAVAPEAIYRVHVSEGSRNNQDRDQVVKVYNQIRTEHLPGWPG